MKASENLKDKTTSNLLNASKLLFFPVLLAITALALKIFVYDDLPPDSCHDVAIIGAGSGGASVLWKLRDDGLKVAIYEQLDRIGGKTGNPAAAQTEAMRYLMNTLQLQEDCMNNTDLTGATDSKGCGTLRHTIHLHHHVQAVKLLFQTENIYQLTIQDLNFDEKALKLVCAKAVVFAVDKPALEEIQRDVPSRGHEAPLNCLGYPNFC